MVTRMDGWPPGKAIAVYEAPDLSGDPILHGATHFRLLDRSTTWRCGKVFALVEADIDAACALHRLHFSGA